MLRNKFYLISFTCVLSGFLTILASNASASVELVGGDLLNGNFNNQVTPSADDAQPFINTVAWVNIGTGDQNAQATRANLDYDGSRNHVLAGGGVRVAGLDTGHTIAAGEIFDISYVWRDASNWDDGSDQISVSLFVTEDNTIQGIRTDLVQDLSGLSTQNSTYELVDHDAIYTATSDVAGKTLFVEIIPVASSSEFCRLDDFTLEVSVLYTASGPSPQNTQEDVRIDTELSWTPGFSATLHNVYLGTSFDDVNNADPANPLNVLVGPGQEANSFNAEGLLKIGETYYWRVDEVNDLDPNSPWKGMVWSFDSEPIGNPITDVSVIASSSEQDPNAPLRTIDSSGLNDNDEHGSNSDDMWLSGEDPNGAWIQYDFGKVHKLHQLLVWNYNSENEDILGYGAKDVLIKYSQDGVTWTDMESMVLDQAPGNDEVMSAQSIDLTNITAKSVQLVVSSNHSKINLKQYGLSEVRFYSIPVFAREPSPDSGATDVSVDVTLTWRPGREAATHDVYLNTDEQAVIDGNTPIDTVTDTSYSSTLDLASTYFWRIDEVNDAETPTTWKGDIWNLSTQEYLVVDDFESYNDLNPDDPESNRIFITWIGGDDDPANGSQVGHDNFPFAEQATVHNGDQSMPLFYDNNSTDYSEATVNIANLPIGQDWSKNGIRTLSLWFYGDPNNAAEQMYVKLNGSKVTYDGDADNLLRIPWQAWNIELADFGVDLSNVIELSIGIERTGVVGGMGVVYFDDIRLYSYDRQLITPTDPGTTGLQAHYEFEGTTNDSSGNANHGTIMGNPVFEPGKIGQAISFDGLSDYVNIDGYKGVVGDGNDTPPWTVTAWVRTSGNGEVVGWGSDGDGNRMEFRIDAGRTRAEGGGGNTQGDTSMNDGQWHHIAVTVQPNSVYSTGIDLWLDGQLDTRSNNDPDPWHPTADFDVKIGIRYNESGREFTGSIDDVRIYDRVLTAEEIAWLAGRNQPFDRPF